jgi:hypothetical protein
MQVPVDQRTTDRVVPHIQAQAARVMQAPEALDMMVLEVHQIMDRAGRDMMAPVGLHTMALAGQLTRGQEVSAMRGLVDPATQGQVGQVKTVHLFANDTPIKGAVFENRSDSFVPLNIVSDNKGESTEMMGYTLYLELEIFVRKMKEGVGAN